jgi:hypothetical protein
MYAFYSLIINDTIFDNCRTMTSFLICHLKYFDINLILVLFLCNENVYSWLLYATEVFMWKVEPWIRVLESDDVLVYFCYF